MTTLKRTSRTRQTRTKPPATPQSYDRLVALTTSPRGVSWPMGDFRLFCDATPSISNSSLSSCVRVVNTQRLVCSEKKLPSRGSRFFPSFSRATRKYLSIALPSRERKIRHVFSISGEIPLSNYVSMTRRDYRFRMRSSSRSSSSRQQHCAIAGLMQE